jgi:uncharacterized protein (TIRG00374 family)
MLRYAVRLIKLAGTALLVIVLFRSVEWQRVLEALAGIRWTWIALALVAVLTRNVVDALEMRVVLARLGLQIGLWRIFFNNALGNLYALVLPGAVLSKGVKFGAMAAAAGKKSAVLNAMIYNGLIQLFPPLVIGLAALAYDNPLPETRVVEMVVVLGVAITIGLAALYHPTLGRHSLNAMRIVLHRLPERFGKRFSGMVDSIERFQQFRPSDHLLVLTIATLAMVLSLVRLSFGFAAMEIDVPVFRVAWIYIFLRVLRLLPLTIGNLGVREGVLIVALARFDVPAETAVALGLVLYCDRLLLALVGLIYQLSLTLGLAKLAGVQPGSAGATIAPVSPPEHRAAA